jgi:GH25 family lysozyme M1 (1,4-beta-N-acetylmuramidase)
MSNAAGEDRSSFQAVQGWGGDSFAFSKATEGTGWSDPTFARNWASARSEGKVRGAYHFFHPADNPAQQAAFFMSHVRAQGLRAGDVLIADVEITAGDRVEAYGTVQARRRSHEGLKELPERMSLAPAAVGSAALQFLSDVATAAGPGVRVLLYTDVFMAQSLLGSCSGYPLFLAYYEPVPITPAPWRRWTFWQNGGTGPGGGDLDYFNGDEAALVAWAGGGSPGNWTEDLVNALPTLQQGSKDSGAPAAWYVHRLQNMVSGYGQWNGLGKVAAIVADGNFGAATKAAVEAVQRHAGIAVDGVAGQATWTVLIG